MIAPLDGNRCFNLSRRAHNPFPPLLTLERRASLLLYRHQHILHHSALPPWAAGLRKAHTRARRMFRGLRSSTT